MQKLERALALVAALAPVDADGGSSPANLTFPMATLGPLLWNLVGESSDTCDGSCDVTDCMPSVVDNRIALLNPSSCSINDSRRYLVFGINKRSKDDIHVIKTMPTLTKNVALGLSSSSFKTGRPMIQTCTMQHKAPLIQRLSEYSVEIFRHS
jgi:hypothetical protein